MYKKNRGKKAVGYEIAMYSKVGTAQDKVGRKLVVAAGNTAERG